MKENYVSFEVSKLLKKRHFHGSVRMEYTESMELVDHGVNTGDFNHPYHAGYSAPTCDQVIHWIESSLGISIERSYGRNDEVYVYILFLNNNREKESHDIKSYNNWESYLKNKNEIIEIILRKYVPIPDDIITERYLFYKDMEDYMHSFLAD